MAISSYPPVQASRRVLVTLSSGTSWTVPTGVTFINATLIGGGGAGGGGFGSAATYQQGEIGNGGQIVSTTLATTPGASIAYAIGAGGTGVVGRDNSYSNIGGSGGNTTFTGATTASGGLGGQGYYPPSSPAGTDGLVSNNGGNGGSYSTGKYSSNGGSGQIIIEYWV